MSSPASVRRSRRKPRTRFHHGDLAEALVVAATELVESEGHAALSLRALARQLGVTQPALYRHYASKEELLAEIALRGLRSLLIAVRDAMVGHGDPGATLESAGRTYVRYAHAHPGWFRLCFSRSGGEAAYPALADVVPEAALATLVPAASAADACRAYWALVHGLATFAIERVSPVEQTDDALSVFIAALRAAGKGQSPS